ncbi:TniQ family protein [Paenibacillus sp. Dod16]|uniref:TniQ family protein n=1 Tax=Paenibacillus sp. Dod16 TaxID=3416392 RepID=UPI003CFB60B4
MNHFLKIPYPYFDEGIRGYLVRLAEENKAIPHQIITMLGVKKINKDILKIRNEIFDFSNLSVLAQQSVEKLNEMTFVKHTEHTLSKNEIDGVFKFGFMNKSSQVCPLCLKDHAYQKKVWEIALYKVCHIHHCLLIDHCPYCNLSIKPFRNCINKCDCGFDYSTFQPNISYKSKMSLLLYEKLDNTKVFSKENYLTQYSLFQIISITNFFVLQIMRYFLHQSHMDIQMNRSKLKLDFLIESVYVLFEDWPKNFNKFIDLIRVRNISFSNRDNSVTYGRLLFSFRKKFKDTNATQIYTQFIKYVCDYWVTGYNYRFMIPDKTSLYMEAKIELLREELMNIERGSLRKVIINTSKETASEVGKILSISKEQITQIIKINHSIYKLPINFASSSEVELAMNTLIKQVNNDTRIKPGENIDFQCGIRISSKYGINLADFVLKIFSGSIMPTNYEPIKSGLNKFYFNKFQLEELYKEGFLDVTDVSKSLNVHRNELLFWTSKKFLTYQKRTPTNGYLFNHSDIENFQKKFIIFKNLINLNKERKKGIVLLRELSKVNIYPISGPKVDGGNGYLFNYSEELLEIYNKSCNSCI